MRFVTLGPSGSNHQFVLTRYLSFHGISAQSQVGLFLDFHEGAQDLIDGRSDFMLQVAVHPETAAIVATYRRSLFVIDTFISGSQDMALICRRDVAHPRSLALQPATRDYVDTSRFQTLIPEVSVASIAQGLIDGRLEAGITSAHLALDMPDRFRIDDHIGTVDDAWIVYGRAPLTNGSLLADRKGPAASLYASMLSGATHG
jgi:hypothetical protein